MNEKNFEYLKDQLKYSGFGEAMHEELREKLEKQSPEFKLFHQMEVGKDQLVSTLHFSKSNQSDMYFFNKYELTMKQGQSSEIKKQTFNNNITLKEGYNLVKGRSVHKSLTNKEGENYQAWLQLDQKTQDANGNYKIQQYHQNYGYDLEKELARYPIQELNNVDEKQMLMRSLERGNRQAVNIQQEGNEQKVFIEANPQYKTLNFYDQHMKPMRSQELKLEQKAEQKSELKPEQKQESGAKKNESKQEQKKKQQKSRGQARSL